MPISLPAVGKRNYVHHITPLSTISYQHKTSKEGNRMDVECSLAVFMPLEECDKTVHWVIRFGASVCVHSKP